MPECQHQQSSSTMSTGALMVVYRLTQPVAWRKLTHAWLCRAGWTGGAGEPVPGWLLLGRHDRAARPVEQHRDAQRGQTQPA